MKCLRCLKSDLAKQESEIYPYVCPACGTAYKAWAGAPFDRNVAQARVDTYKYWSNNHKGDVADRMSYEELKKKLNIEEL